MPSRIFLILAAGTVQLLTACWPHVDNNCPYNDHCEGQIIRSCTNGDEPGQGYRLSQTDCGKGKTCTVPSTAIPECVLTPLQACTRSTCDGDAKVTCGKSGYAASVTDCTASGRICRESGTTAECVLPDAPCPAERNSFCAPDGSGIYRGCDQGFGYATKLESCPATCGSPVCHDGATDAACVSSPVKTCTTMGNECSADRKLSLRCDKVGDMLSCETDCSERGQICMPSRGICGYEIACPSNGDHACSPDGRAVYGCDSYGHFVTNITRCDASDPDQICISSTWRCGYDIACAQGGNVCSPDGRAIYYCNYLGLYVESIRKCPPGKKCQLVQSSMGGSLECR